MSRKGTSSLLRISAGLILVGSRLWAAPIPVNLTATLPASGDLSEHSGTIGIGGKIFQGYLWCGAGFATWRVPAGYSSFEGYCGVNDTYSGISGAVVEFLIDGDLIKSVSLSSGQKATMVSIPVASGQSFRINIPKCGVAVAEPRFLSAPTGQADVFSAGNSPSAIVGSPTYGVDPNGLDRLADSLRKQCEQKPALKAKMENGQVAISRFSLINISAKSVSETVVENLYTAMIKCGFSLVERGQLDSVLDELKIQDSGAVDPTTAQKIGKLSGCDIILLGSISDQGLLIINARMMDTATGKSLVAERVELQKIAVSR